MIIETVIVQNFRNFEQHQLVLHPQLTLIIGENTRGKTSLLEGIFALVHGEGFREEKEEELIRWEQPMGNIAGVVIADHHKSQYQVMLRRIGERIEKHYFINKTKVSHGAFLKEQTKAVLFTPDNIEIITGSPSRRRTFLNKLIALTDPEYKKRLNNYENALRKRNKLLEQTKNLEELRSELSFWDGYLEDNGMYVSRKRSEFIDFCNSHPELSDRNFRIEYRQNTLSRSLLEERLRLERKTKKTGIGPQKDDIVIYQTHEGVTKDVALYGSRSEQRLAMLWLKLKEIAYIESVMERRPVLLLDDVFSELDSRNKQIVMQIMNQYQTILTTTDEELIDLASEEKTVVRL
ncbi:MAG: DNA replication/repair protein RecF [Patescibacteria group bacterium]